MKCPRCGNEWNASKGSCTRCGFAIRMTSPRSPMDRSSNIPQSNELHSGKMSPANPPFSSSSTPPVKEPSSGMRPIPATPLSGGISSIRPSSADALSLKHTPPPLSKQPSTDSLTLDHHLQVSRIPQIQQTQQAPSQQQPERNRLITVPLSKDGRGAPTQRSIATSAAPSSSSSHLRSTSSPARVRSLLPGTLLHNGRYRLGELRERQDWAPGVFEAMWIGQDAYRGATQVMICELVVPDNPSTAMQSSLRDAAKVLISIGRHSRIPTLLDAFNDQERSFFVFEPVEGESVGARVAWSGREGLDSRLGMRNSGRPLPEQDVIECCLQMTEVLELLAHQSPPMVHGLIRPEHIIIGRSGSQYILTNFSVILASGATQLIEHVERSHLSPYTASELARGVIDPRSDLYSLIATAYYAVTGSVPTAVNGGIPQAQRINGNISPQFDEVLMKGLRPVASQRYQRPSELRQDLLAIRSGGPKGAELAERLSVLRPAPMYRPNGGAERDLGDRVASGNPNLVARNAQRPASSLPTVPDSVAQALPILLAPTDEIEDHTGLLPRPEALPPMPQSDDWRNAAIWLGAILLCLIILVVVGQALLHS